MLGRVKHIGVAVNDLETAVPLYRDVFGLDFRGRERSESEQIDTASFRAGDVDIELMQPLNADSPVGRFLEKRGEGIHHVAYAVPDLDAALETARAAGLEIVGDAARGGLHETRVVFIHPRSVNGVLTELVEDP